ncbi:MAG: DUF2293 domain-containing protein [Pirellulales bacterium]
MPSRRKDVDTQQGRAPAEQRAGLKVFISSRDSRCDECGEALRRGAWILLAGGRGALCLACADLDHLTFLHPGNAALTRRAQKHSRLSAVVLKFRRGRYERQGLLVEEAGLAKAEAECLADEDLRLRRQAREAQRREELDERYVGRFARRVRDLFPGCPVGREQTIAEHACRKHSGRVGRSAAAKELDEQAVRMAVVAHIRHVLTNYDELLGTGHERSEARRLVAAQIDEWLRSWTQNPAGPAPQRLHR